MAVGRLTAQNSPELHFHFYESFYPTISGRISGTKAPEAQNLHQLKFTHSDLAVSYGVNLMSQCSHLELLLLSKFWSERDDFN